MYIVSRAMVIWRNRVRRPLLATPKPRPLTFRACINIGTSSFHTWVLKPYFRIAVPCLSAIFLSFLSSSAPPTQDKPDCEAGGGDLQLLDLDRPSLQWSVPC